MVTIKTLDCSIFHRALIVESFIPPEEKNKLMNRAFYDEENEVWKLRPVAENNRYTIA